MGIKEKHTVSMKRTIEGIFERNKKMDFLENSNVIMQNAPSFSMIDKN